MTRARIYLGLRLDTSAVREIFRATFVPNVTTHGDKFGAVIGPFRTMRAAEFMRDYGRGNPHCLCVADAERLARVQA